MGRRWNERDGISGHWVEWDWGGSEEIGVLLVRAGARLAVQTAHSTWLRWGVEHLVGVVVPVQPSQHGEGLATLVAPVRRVWVDMALHVLLQSGPRREVLLTETAVIGSSLGSQQLCWPRGVDALLDHHQLVPDPTFQICCLVH